MNSYNNSLNKNDLCIRCAYNKENRFQKDPSLCPYRQERTYLSTGGVKKFDCLRFYPKDAKLRMLRYRKG